MAITVRCTNAECGKPCRVKDELAGKVVKCPTCGTRIKVALAGVAPVTQSKLAAPPAAVPEEIVLDLADAPPPSAPFRFWDAVSIPGIWRGAPSRHIPAFSAKVLSFDRILVMSVGAMAFVLGLLMATRVVRVYSNANDWEMGMLLVLFAPCAYVLAAVFHRFLRNANRYYVPFTLFYLLAAFALYGTFLSTALDFVLGPAPLGQPRSAGVNASFLIILFGYILTFAMAAMACLRSDLKTAFLPPGSISFGVGAVCVLIAVPITVYTFAQFLGASAHSSYLMDFLKFGALACAFSIPGTILSQRAERLRKAAAKATPRAPFLRKVHAPFTSESHTASEPISTGRMPFRFAMRNVLIAFLAMESLLILLGVNQLRSGNFGPTEIVRTNELSLPGASQSIKPRAEDECILWFCLQGYTPQDLNANRNTLHMQVSGNAPPGAIDLPRLTAPLNEIVTSSPTPLGSIDRVYFIFSIPRSATFPNLKITANRSIAFKLPDEIVPRYEPSSGLIFSWLWLAILLPILAGAGFGIARLVGKKSVTDAV